ncbi:MAG: phosphopyruvate hydratase [Candidatus Micrarchaeia archaeon]
MVVALADMKIKKVVAGTGYNSRSNPTVFGGIIRSDGKPFFFTVDSGASTGTREALELLDGGKRFDGKGVKTAVRNIKEILAPLVEGKITLATTQGEFDRILASADDTGNFSKIGANAILPLSAAYARMRADAMGETLFDYLNREVGAPFSFSIPVPFMNVFNAGKHAAQAKGAFPGQELMIGPVGAENAAQAMEMGVGTWKMMGKMLKERQLPISIGDEGGYANPFATARESFKFIKEAAERAGYRFGKDIVLAVDPAASEFFGKEVHESDGMAHGRKYHFECGQLLSPAQMGDFWAGMAKEFPILSMEDIHAQNDYAGWKYSTKTMGNRIQLVGDDVFCTNKSLLNMGIRGGIANSVLIKLNQNGTVYGTLEVMKRAMENGYTAMVSHRSGLGMDDFISYLSVLTGQIKAGSSRERMIIYNTILMLEETYGLKYAGISAFSPDVQAYWNATWNK